MSEFNIVHTTETPAPEYVERRRPYCTGCEGAEIQECMDEVLYEGASRAEALRHAHQYFAPMVCESCQGEAEEAEELAFEQDEWDRLNEERLRQLQEEWLTDGS